MTAPAEPMPPDLAALLAAAAAEEQAEYDADRRPGLMGDAAAWYAAHGWPVIPLWWPVISRGRTGCACGDAECSSVGKHPISLHGLDNATRDAGLVRAAWARYPQANIGVRTGSLPDGAGFDVLDFDGPEGLQAFADARDAGGLGEALGVAWTGGAGKHLLIPATGQRNGAKLGPGLDYRGDGGYVCVPPSLHERGFRYRWIDMPAAIA